MAYAVIDLFAGPGGLAEGFSSLVNQKGKRIFEIKLSIEKNKQAHQTLKLRSFLRQFPVKDLPIEYYHFLAGKLSLQQLYETYPAKFKKASKEAWQATLGETPKEVIDARITEALGQNSNWVLIGGPPCQAFSSAGRSRVGGIAEDDGRVYLYKEYLRIIAKHHPAIFVMENVEGLLSAKLNGEHIFDWIVRDLTHPASVFEDSGSPSYKIHSLVEENIKKSSDYLIKAEEFGIPQNRHRVILVGVRCDINHIPEKLKRLESVSLKSVIGVLPKIRSGISRSFSHSYDIVNENGNIKKKRIYNKVENTFENWCQVVNKFTDELSIKLDQKQVAIKRPKNIGKEFLKSTPLLMHTGHVLYEWYIDENLPGITHHVSRNHLAQDLKRYLFATTFTEEFHKTPRLSDYKEFDEALLPDHSNVNSGKFIDRFRVQVPDKPATTITSHISKDGHYFIHYDNSQCRTLTVREAARIQTFPDNFFFCGCRTEQYHQVGNAVPPYLAYKIAETINNLFKKHNSATNIFAKK